MSLKDSMGKKRTVLLQNTVMLYLLQFSTYILSFIAVPYETRVLGTEAYGVLGATTAVMVYFQLVIDFGFLLSATEEVSAKRNDTAALRKILTKVTVCKLGLALLSGAVLLLLCRCVGAWRGRTVLFFLFYISSVFTSLMPDYLYRGMEKICKSGAVNMGLAAVTGTLANTIFVLGGIYVVFGASYAAANGIAYELLLGVIGTVILTNGVLEIVLAVLAAIAVCTALKKVLRRG